MRHPRAKYLSLAALGSVISLLLGSGIFALITDSAASAGNSAESDTFTAGHQDIRVAFEPGISDCPPLFGPNGRPTEDYSDGPIRPTVDDQISLSDSQEPVLSSFEVCVANYGSSAGDVDVQFPSSSVLNSEVTCEPAEEQSQADACTAEDFANDPGELDQVLYVHAWMDFLDREVAGDFTTFVAQPQYLFSLAPGEAKPVEFSIEHAGGLSDDQKNIAQTDKVQWDAVFTLHDPLPATTDQSSGHV